MSVEAELLELFESEVTVKPADALNRAGEATWGIPALVQAHIERKAHLVVDTEGRQVRAEGRVLLTTVEQWIDTACQLVLDDGATPPILVVETTYGPNLDTGTSGPYQTILHFGA